MTHRLIINARVITADQVLPDHCIEIKDGQIASVFPSQHLQALEKDIDIYDANDAYAAPGLIDLHIHGFGGFGPELGTVEALLQMSLELAKQGVSGFCPTLYCGRPQQMRQILENTVGAFGKEQGARLLGYHLEGPFISPQKPGVMKPQDISPINLTVMEELWQAAQGHIAIMTAAPELPGIEMLARFCQEKHILLQAGHTNATYEEFLKGADLGLTHATHLFNAMSSFNHRSPGAAGAVLMQPNVSAEIIADGVHVHPDVVRFVGQLKSPQNLVLITDALRPTGQEHPPFLANAEEVVFEGGVWKRATDHVIAGSALTMLQGIKNLVQFGFSLPQAVACASANPARLVGLKNEGSLTPGMNADITVFDRQFRPLRTFLSGR